MNELVMKEPKEMTAEELGGEIRMLTGQARGMILSYGIQIGYRLKLAHEKVGPHGWAEWLKNETGFSRPTASRLEKVFDGYGGQIGLFGVENNFSTLKNISVSNALRLLAVPEEERESFAEEVDAEHISARELEQAIKERDEARKALKDTEDELARSEKLRGALCDEQAGMREKIRELEHRPVEVAVQVDEEAVKRAAEDARAAEKQENAAVIAALRDRLDAAEKQKKAAEEKAAKAKEKAQTAAETAKKEAEDAAANARAEAEQAKKEAEELRKRLISAESGAGEAAIYAKAAQENFFAALNKIDDIRDKNEVVARRLAEGILSILSELTVAAEELRKGIGE